jgi:hypothetical protein
MIDSNTSLGESSPQKQEARIQKDRTGFRTDRKHDLHGWKCDKEELQMSEQEWPMEEQGLGAAAIFREQRRFEGTSK